MNWRLDGNYNAGRTNANLPKQLTQTVSRVLCPTGLIEVCGIADQHPLTTTDPRLSVGD